MASKDVSVTINVQKIDGTKEVSRLDISVKINAVNNSEEVITRGLKMFCRIFSELKKDHPDVVMSIEVDAG